WLAWRAEIPERIGYGRDGRSFLLTKAIPVPEPWESPAHEKFYYLELIRRAGFIDCLPEVPWIELKVPEQKRRTAEEFLVANGARNGRKRIAVGAGASYGSAKCWFPERFAETLNNMRAGDADVILFGTAGEKAVSDAIVAGLKIRPIDLTGRTTIADL